jgi:hypothetical protein
MRKLFLIAILLALFAGRATATDIDIGASSITGFNNQNLGADTNLSGLSVTLGSPNVTCSNCLLPGWVGLSGFKVSLAGVVYDVAGVSSRSAYMQSA